MTNYSLLRWKGLSLSSLESYAAVIIQKSVISSVFLSDLKEFLTKLIESFHGRSEDATTHGSDFNHEPQMRLSEL